MKPTRRAFLASLPALALASRTLAQERGATLRARGINHVSLGVTDLKRSVDFYQNLFGLTLRRISETNVQLVLGAGPLHLGLGKAPVAKIDHFCLGIEDFDPIRVSNILAAHGLERATESGTMKHRITPGPGGAPSVSFDDPDGINVQLQDISFCGGSGPLGNVCRSPEESPINAPIALKGYSHLTITSSDASKSNAFYRNVFGLGIRAYQGPTAPALAVGPTVEFLMFTGGGGSGAGRINHFCFNLENFNVEQIQKALESVGIKPRENQTGPVGPMRHYVTMRMANRGGARDGTPELYFTDPDGILVQLQDVKYCGGSGYLGDVCPPV
jgi:catechol 2,3-dioxygenase-like lactoylglutathione lyase family enzyme